ncbi:sulfurtransferase [Clostridium oceanicum]|uniref:thiosulfate sulfurtransferase n=1 Tax=Clostridium oceanicum TaxID=1543 RepID=A0ABP3V3V7_9CLOT
MLKNRINFKKLSSLFLSFALIGSLFVGCANNKTSSDNDTKEKKSNAKLEQKYTDNSYLMNPEKLSKDLKKENLLIIDARSKKEYKKGHIPGAINVQWQYFTNTEGKSGDKGWGMLLSKDKLSEKFSDLGIDKNKDIIVYASNKKGWGEDGRIVWMLRMAGLNKSKMLNGGFVYWENNDFEISKDTSEPKKNNFKIENLDMKTYADTAWTKENINKAVILDAREEKEYKGATDFGEARGGHLPKAKLFTFNKVFNDDETLKSEKEIKDMLTKAGIKKDDQILTYCTAGIRSAHLALILKMVGYDNVKNYDGSYYRWAAEKDLKLEK